MKCIHYTVVCNSTLNLHWLYFLLSALRNFPAHGKDAKVKKTSEPSHMHLWVFSSMTPQFSPPINES